MTRVIVGILALFLSAGVAASQEPIVELQLTPGESTFKGAAWNKPLVLTSQVVAAKHFDKDALAVLAKKVDFKKQIVLIFAWRGSGGDKLEYKILESFPEQIHFSLSTGRTRDLRFHSRVFAVRSNVKWSLKPSN